MSEWDVTRADSGKRGLIISGTGAARPDFRELLPVLLQGEDPDFQSYIRKIANEEADVKLEPGADIRRAETGILPTNPPVKETSTIRGHGRLYRLRRRSKLGARSKG